MYLKKYVANTAKYTFHYAAASPIAHTLCTYIVTLQAELEYIEY